MPDSVQPIRLPAVTAPASRKGGRGKGTPFTLNEEPPPDAEGEHSDPAPKARYPEHDIGHKPNDEEGATLDVTG
ncbi:MAG: hypothetical protein ACI8QZ_000010 [Chlamydiales bacterium]|jgi:hypothetical protein